MILDTSFLIDVLRGTPAVGRWERKLADEELGIAASISVMEL